MDQDKPLSLERFDKIKDEISAKVRTINLEEIRGISIKDKDAFSKVLACKKSITPLRTSVTKTGKLMRDKANEYRKVVLDYEKELLSLIQPIESVLDERIKEHTEYEVMESRKEKLPLRKSMISKEKFEYLGKELKSDEEILKMDDEQFMYYLGDVEIQYNEKKDKERVEKEREKEMIEQAQKDAEERVQKREEALNKEQERIREHDEKMKREKEEAEAKEQVKKDNARAIDQLLTTLGLSDVDLAEGNCKVDVMENGHVHVWKKVGSLDLNTLKEKDDGFSKTSHEIIEVEG